nr:tyrosine-type recombinase/integrase [Pseudomonas aeruginosa]
MDVLWPKENDQTRINCVLKKHGLLSLFPPQYSYAHFRLPIILMSDGSINYTAYMFLREKSQMAKSVRPTRTIKTYAESLKSWFVYLDMVGIGWRETSIRNLFMYRQYMIEKSGLDRGRTLSPATINLRITVVAEFYRYSWSRSGQVSDSYISSKLKQLDKFKSIRVRGKQKRPRALSGDECAAILSNLSGVHKLIFRWALCTGLRTSSILSIEKDHFVGQRFLEVPVKGGKIIDVYVPEDLVRETSDYIRIERLLSIPKGQGSTVTTDSPFLFIGRNGKAVAQSSYYRAFKRAAARAKVKANPHQARTTFATAVSHRLEQLKGQSLGVDGIKIIQGLLGHASSQTTEIYLERIATHRFDVLQLLDEMCGAIK